MVNLRWFLTFVSLVANLCISLNTGKAGSGTALYSSRVFLCVPLGGSEAEVEAMLVALTTVYMLVEAAGPSVTEVLLVDNGSFHCANLAARVASSVIVPMPICCGAQVPQGLKQCKINAASTVWQVAGQPGD